MSRNYCCVSRSGYKTITAEGNMMPERGSAASGGAKGEFHNTCHQTGQSGSLPLFSDDKKSHRCGTLASLHGRYTTSTPGQGILAEKKRHYLAMAILFFSRTRSADLLSSASASEDSSTSSALDDVAGSVSFSMS